jgi:hypothetical protein
MNDTEISEAQTRKTFIDKALEQAGWGPVVPFKPGARYGHGSVEEYPTSQLKALRETLSIQPGLSHRQVFRKESPPRL